MTDFYPTVVDDEENLAVERNLVHSPLVSAVTSTQTTFTVEDGENYDPAGGVIELDDEACTYTSVSIGPPDTLNGVSRGQFQFDGYGPVAAHDAGTLVLQYNVPPDQHTHAQQIIELETKLGTGASVPAADKVLTGTGPGASAWQVRPSAVSNQSKTIAAGLITLDAIGPHVSLIELTADTEASAASDDLDTINVTGTVPNATLLVVRQATSARNIVLTDDGNMKIGPHWGVLLFGYKHTLDVSTDDRALFLRVNGGWIMIGGSAAQ
jgi:hypothetical protein